MSSETASPALRISINGDPHSVPGGMTVAGLLSELGMAERRIAVARNGEVVPKSSFDEAGLDAGDRIEILEAVGGG